MKVFLLLILCSVHIIASTAENNTECFQRVEKYGTVCVCNSSYCDSVPLLLDSTEYGFYQVYLTGQMSPGFHSETGIIDNKTDSTPLTVTIKSRNDTKQTIMGFGGAFTGSATNAILSLSENTRTKIFESYFGETGIQYTFGRVPIGTSDFAVTGSSNCDTKDETLESFVLTTEDINFKIPAIQAALNLRGKELKLFTASRSPPAWMKNSDLITLNEKYYALWAKYYLKFFKAYGKHNITFWGTTTQNEPFNGAIGNTDLILKFSTSAMNEWHTKYFGPAIRNSSFRDMKIMINDDNFSKLKTVKAQCLSNREVEKYTDGVAVHWYTSISQRTNDMFTFPETVFLLATEACQGVPKEYAQNNVQLGNWQRAVDYINDIMYDLEHNFVGWVEWNLALDTAGGPSWVNASLDSPIITNVTSDEFYKQPMFYVIGHFSKAVIPNSIKLQAYVSTEFTNKGLKAIAFQRPDEKIVLIIYNGANETVKVQTNILLSKQAFNLKANSLNTVIFSNV